MYEHLFRVVLATGEISKTPVPPELYGFPDDQLADLSWAAAYAHWAWFPADNQFPPLGRYQSYTNETWELDLPRKVIIVRRDVVNWTAQEILHWKMTTARRITHSAFRDRFTMAEQIGMETVTGQGSAIVRVMEKNLAVAPSADLNSTRLKEIIQQLETDGVIATGRAEEIIWGDIEDYEIA